MRSFRDDESIHSMQSTQSDSQVSSAPGEKIFVAVRLRPLNEKEKARSDASDWDCINNSTVIYKHGLPEKSLFPSAYRFDRVFASECSTKQVYEEGPKNVALSVVSGINTSIFAYGQTSSGKTYTMRGITEYTMADIFDYIHEHNEREFVVKFSAMEIYNESVRDLLGLDNTPLRLLDDPERGTVVEKLTEVTLRDWSHLKDLLAVCEAERQIGETSLNETSSRSHQIIRLTVESSACEFLGAYNSSILAASVSFVDLAGSERASQTLSVGSRLKEGSHINRSLLTLGTVIRKLSKSRNGHVPFRDSKLTRILQNSLGGNARTAIILMSEKALVKQLQKELARLENDMRSVASVSTSGNSDSLLEEKERIIEKMSLEIKELTKQRDLAQSRIQEMLQSTSDNQVSKTRIAANYLSEAHEKRLWHSENSVSDSPEVTDPPHLNAASNIPYRNDRPLRHDNVNTFPQLPDNSEEIFLSDGSPNKFMDKYFGPDLSHGWGEIAQNNYESSEESFKEVRCVEMENDKDKCSETSSISSPLEGDGGLEHVLSDHTCEALKPKSTDMQATADKSSVCSKPTILSSSLFDTAISGSGDINILKSSSFKEVDTTMSEKSEKDVIPLDECEKGLAKTTKEPMINTSGGTAPIHDFTNENDFVGEKEQNTQTRRDPNSDSHIDGAIENKEVLKPDHEVIYEENTVQDTQKYKYEVMVKIDDGSTNVHSPEGQYPDWKLEFERQRKQIIQLWDACDIPLVHRAYFFLLFQGDQSDSVYMEVEFRRLSFLKQTASRGKSSRALKRERDMLSRQILKKYSTKEREALYRKWGIELKSKQRRKQLSRLLWNDTQDMDHIKESAAVVAKLVGQPSQAPKETFGLSFTP
ncbi:kinesin-like protein NACK2 [Heracleum sosnowskyi]|uniref:Kinesin-like protein n=1 Tax=Heracleum sosnowskyi TaxID=360622 RepID=A0AAD8IWI8_9APIA|nr:kinesin-like protein NACK2 [Heracleum sosnowskyi]